MLLRPEVECIIDHNKETLNHVRQNATEGEHRWTNNHRWFHFQEIDCRAVAVKRYHANSEYA